MGGVRATGGGRVVSIMVCGGVCVVGCVCGGVGLAARAGATRVVGCHRQRAAAAGVIRWGWRGASVVGGGSIPFGRIEE